MLLPPQKEVLDIDLLNSGFSCVLQMPTGSGKTWLAELAIESVLKRGYRAVYLAPLRALASELSNRWQARFAGWKVGIFTGDYGKPGLPYPVPFREAQLLVMTPERLNACTRAWRSHWTWIPEVDLVVVDELHLLGDTHRGPRLEGTISRMRRLNPFVRFVGLSATLGNRGELADWLEGVEYVSAWRPIPLRWCVVRYRKATDKPMLMAEQVARNVQAGGKSLVFVQSRRRAEELSRYLQTTGLRARHHHAGLGRTERQSVENGFRAHEMDVLVATSTLEMGVNLPVRQVVLYDLQAFDGVDFRPISTNSVWQRVGRAGRPGLDDEGEAVLLAPAWDRQAERYERGKFEPIRSGLADRRALAEQVVTEVASGLARTWPQLERVFAQSLAARQEILPKVNVVITEMRDAGMIQERLDEKAREPRYLLKATRLGRIAVRHFLAPATVLTFRRTLETFDLLTFLDLLIIVACSDDCQPVLPVDFEELDAIACNLAGESSFLLQHPRVEIVEAVNVDGKRLLAAVKMALVTRAWTRCSDANEVAERHDCYPFEVARLSEAMDRLLLAMAAIPEKPEEEEGKEEPKMVDDEDMPVRERIRALQRMVCTGLDEFAATLTLVDGIGPKMAKRLLETGIEDIEDLALAESAELAEMRGLSKERAERWIAKAEEVVETRSAYRYRETGPYLNITPPGWPSELDPYRLRRALDLTVVGVDGGAHLVTGGLEPHIVRFVDGELTCDCVDASRGNLCKHRLAVRMQRGDRQLYKLARQIGRAPASGKIDLFDLWFGNHSIK
ncbi:MAG: DEAD/DEAH box helicase [Chloroflexi bacterium]|nr:DEAD/DEAH box helicase [Chloroflexota bacterium]